jgi:hypothetical protein
LTLWRGDNWKISLPFPFEGKTAEGEDYGFILTSAAENMDKMVDVMNDGVNGISEVVLDGMQAIKSGADLIGSFLTSETEESRVISS